MNNGHAGSSQASVASAEDLAALRSVLQKFCAENIRPRIRELENAEQFPRELYKALGELGAFGCIIPEELGGSNMGFEALALVSEELAYAYPPVSAAMNLQAATVPLTIKNWGRPDQVSKYVPGLINGTVLGSNAMTEPDGGTDLLGAMRTTAKRDGDAYIINGSKMWITNANVADVVIVYCKTDTDRQAQGRQRLSGRHNRQPGFEANRVKCRVLGNLMPTNGLTFTDMRVPGGMYAGTRRRGLQDWQ